MPLMIDIAAVVEEVITTTPVIDIHTHLFGPELGALGLWGIDNLLTYHYLEAELFRSSTVSPRQYWSLEKPAQADLIWRALFVENTPLSEATRGVIAALNALGLDTRADNLKAARDFFDGLNVADHITNVLRIAGVSSVVMTNDPLDRIETAEWNAGHEPDARFHAALRLDRILTDLGGAKPAEVRKFLDVWVARMKPLYMAVSLADSFTFPSGEPASRLLAESVLPACRDWNIPLALMIGVRRQVNPALRLAGDGVGRADLRSIEFICGQFPENRFLVTVLSRENQHELCVYARKFANLMPFGCWWFLNNPSIVEEITRERLEMLGASFIPQHSDARILEQLIYKWRNTRRTLAPILTRSYQLLAEDGRQVTREDIQRDVHRLFQSNFEHFTNRVD
jgi:hypothetical protein